MRPLGQAVARPRLQAAHSPQGETAGTSTRLPTRSRPAQDAAHDLVAEHQGQPLFGVHVAVGEAEVRVANAAADHLEERKAVWGLVPGSVLPDQRLASLLERPYVS